MRSIQRFLTFWTFIGLSSLLFLFALLLYISTRSIIQSQVDGSLAASVEALASTVELEDGGIEIEPGEQVAASFAVQENPDYFEIWFHDGGIFHRSPSLQGEDLPRRVGSRNPFFFDMVLPDGYPGRAVGIRFRPEADDEAPSQPGPLMDLVVARSRHPIDRALDALLLGLFGGGILTVLGAALLVRIVVARGLAPLSELAAQAAGIDAGSLHTRFSVQEGTMPLEIRPICARLNDLMERIDVAFRRERRFTSDAAHELRTPIAELRALAEVALYERSTETEETATIRSVLDITLQMERLVSTLLRLARCQDGRDALRLEEVRPAAIVRETANEFAKECAGEERNLRLDLDETLRSRTDRSALRSIVSNLLGNAAAYSVPNTPIEVVLEQRGDGFRLTVANTCSDLAREDLPKMFEPFWRKDPARSDGTHSGLGLTLASALAGLLDLSLRADMKDESTIRMILERSKSQQDARVDPSEQGEADAAPSSS